MVWKQPLTTATFADFFVNGFLRFCSDRFLRGLFEFGAQSFAEDSAEVKDDPHCCEKQTDSHRRNNRHNRGFLVLFQSQLREEFPREVPPRKGSCDSAVVDYSNVVDGVLIGPEDCEGDDSD